MDYLTLKVICQLHLSALNWDELPDFYIFTSATRKCLVEEVTELHSKCYEMVMLRCVVVLYTVMFNPREILHTMKEFSVLCKPYFLLVNKKVFYMRRFFFAMLPIIPINSMYTVWEKTWVKYFCHMYLILLFLAPQSNKDNQERSAELTTISLSWWGLNYLATHRNDMLCSSSTSTLTGWRLSSFPRVVSAYVVGVVQRILQFPQTTVWNHDISTYG